MPSLLYRLIDQQDETKLATRLRRLRKAGFSYRDIAHQLSEGGYEVSHETVRKWCNGNGA